jgi:hypothetical protein
VSVHEKAFDDLRGAVPLEHDDNLALLLEMLRALRFLQNNVTKDTTDVNSKLETPSQIEKYRTTAPALSRRPRLRDAKIRCVRWSS